MSKIIKATYSKKGTIVHVGDRTQDRIYIPDPTDDLSQMKKFLKENPIPKRKAGDKFGSAVYLGTGGSIKNKEL